MCVLKGLSALSNAVVPCCQHLDLNIAKPAARVQIPMYLDILFYFHLLTHDAICQACRTDQKGIGNAKHFADLLKQFTS